MPSGELRAITGTKPILWVIGLPPVGGSEKLVSGARKAWLNPGDGKFGKSAGSRLNGSASILIEMGFCEVKKTLGHQLGARGAKINTDDANVTRF